jgi:hypothetical protein
MSVRGEVGWATISTKLSEIVTPDVENKTAAVLVASLALQSVMLAIKLYSRANPTPSSQTCPGMYDANKPVQSAGLQNGCDLLIWTVAIIRNIWVVRYVADTHPIQMRSAFRLPSLIYHSILGNTSPFVLEIVAYAVIGYFFKIMAFKSDDGAETCSSPGGTWVSTCTCMRYPVSQTHTIYMYIYACVWRISQGSRARSHTAPRQTCRLPIPAKMRWLATKLGGALACYKAGRRLMHVCSSHACKGIYMVTSALIC